MIESFKLPNITPETISGAICSFNDEYGGLPLKSCTSLITGYQEGSGTPSPDNVRPLHAWSGASLGKCDNNTASLWTIDNSFNGDVEFNQLVKDKNSTIFHDITYSIINNVVSLNGTADGRFLTTFATPVRDHVMFVDVNYIGTPTRYVVQNVYGAFRSPIIYKHTLTDVNAYYILVQNEESIDETFTLKIHDLTQMFGSTIADYICNLETQTAGAGVAFFKALYPNNYYPYNAGTKQLVGDTLATFTFGQSIYQGSIDWKSGGVVGTWGYIASYNGETISGEWLCDRAVYDAGATPPTGSQVAYELATPIEIPLGGINLLTQQGVNNIFCDTGDTTLEWLKVN